MSPWDERERDAFVRRMQRRGATLAHTSGRMQSIGKYVGDRWVHLTFSDRADDYGRVWVTEIVGGRTSVKWVNEHIESWFRLFDEDMP